MPDSDGLLTLAEMVAACAKDKSAWNFTPYHRKRITKRTANQHGAYYTFNDGSAITVPKGSAQVIIRK